MTLILPDILSEFCRLSLPLTLAGFGIGIVLLLFGWWSHRFWIVLVITVGAGLYGLSEARQLQTHPFVASIFLALAAGTLALSLARLAAFIAAGVLGLLAIQALVPSFNQHLIGFLSAGMLGSLFYRFWIMALSSLSGAMLTMVCALSLFERGTVFNTIVWTEKSPIFCSVVCGVVAVFGFGFQIWRERQVADDEGGDEEKKGEPKSKKAWPIAGPWGRRNYRKAG